LDLLVSDQQKTIQLIASFPDEIALVDDVTIQFLVPLLIFGIFFLFSITLYLLLWFNFK
jgi:hypothetical protein